VLKRRLMTPNKAAILIDIMVVSAYIYLGRIDDALNHIGIAIGCHIILHYIEHH
jgi:hypothetical protein